MTPARAPARAVDAKEDAFWTSGASSVQADETTEYQDQEGENSLEDALEEGEGDETVILSLHHPRQVDTSPPSAHVLSLAPEPSSREESSVPTEEEEQEEEPDELSTVVEVVQEASMIDGPMSFSPKLEEISVRSWVPKGRIGRLMSFVIGEAVEYGWRYRTAKQHLRQGRRTIARSGRNDVRIVIHGNLLLRLIQISENYSGRRALLQEPLRTHL